MKVALIDCNAFFVSCELLFRPDLKNHACVVLSGNDGCVVSRNTAAKALKVKMGQPFFEIRHLTASKKLTAFSSNFALYADCSRRVKNLIGEIFGHQEVYSIDESFVAFEEDMGVNEARHVRERIFRETGIPVSIGIAQTKVLAKLATDQAKSSGVFELKPEDVGTLLQVPVEEIWGIAKASGIRLRSIGITSALDLKNADMTVIRKVGGVVLERIARELSGTPCLQIGGEAGAKKSITVSQSFGKNLRELRDIEEALNRYVSDAAQELRSQGSVCQTVEVLLSTNRFQEDPYYATTLVRLPFPTNETPPIIQGAIRGLERVFRNGRDYQKTGVTLLGLQPNNAQHSDLFENDSSPKNSKLMDAVDQLNRRLGKDTVTFGRVQGEVKGERRHDLLSPAYTSNWEQLPMVVGSLD
jgi:DNA polymerase V